MLKLSSLIVAALLAAINLARNADNDGLKWCGGQSYNQTEYICTAGLLCPYISGNSLARCGNGCYSQLLYNCSNGQLNQLQPETKPFKLLALNPSKLALASVEACGQAIYIKEDGPCTYCPTAQVGKFCPAGTETVLFAGDGMDTLVPGGQRYYVDPMNGALAFTQAHSNSAPPYAIFGIEALEGGAFLLSGMDGWLACPPSSSSDSRAPAPLGYQIRAPLLVDYDSPTPAAWEYT